MAYNLYQRAKNFLSAAFFLFVAYLFYTNHSMFKKYFDHSYFIPILNKNIGIFQVFRYTLILYLLFLFIIYFLQKHAKAGKGMYALRGLRKIIFSPLETFEKGIFREERTSILAVLLKIFFTPLMIYWLVSNGSQFLQHLVLAVSSRQLILTNFISIFQLHIFWVLFNLILLVDIVFFAIGYLVELPLLKNEIISVDPTVFGWLVTLICYPPFNSYAENILMWKSTDFPFFSNNYIFMTVNISILALMSIYSWASVALCFKASNLTHRGIVSSGPYRFIRHPAYVCKNMAWCLGSLVFMIPAWNQGIIPFLLVLLSLSAWLLIYFLRAMTEERHLMSVNKEYFEYAKKVPYRFIPYVV